MCFSVLHRGWNRDIRHQTGGTGIQRRVVNGNRHCWRHFHVCVGNYEHPALAGALAGRTDFTDTATCTRQRPEQWFTQLHHCRIFTVNSWSINMRKVNYLNFLDFSILFFLTRGGSRALPAPTKFCEL